MKYPDYRRYLVTDTQWIEKYEEICRGFENWLNVELKRFRAEGAVVTTHLVGIYFENDTPPDEVEAYNPYGRHGWYKVGDAPDTFGAIRPYFMPRRDSMSGKHAYQRLGQWVKPTWAHFQQIIGLTKEFEEKDGLILWANYDQIGDQYIINVPYTNKKIPRGTVPINESEYWRMREEYERAVPKRAWSSKESPLSGRS